MKTHKHNRKETKQPKQIKEVTVASAFTPDLADRLWQLAYERRVSRSKLIREAVTIYLDDNLKS